jgi:C-terminal processing protease CtpA/Prc
VGATTAGSTGNPLFFDLPGGGGFSVCTRYMLLPDGSEFIGLGIPPDVEVGLSAADIAASRDPVLERAVAELGKGPR